MRSITVLSALLSLLAAGTFAQLVVETPNGRLRGRDQGTYYTYESVPYAEPPVGELRLEPPKPFNRKWDGIYDATKPSVVCAQWSQFIQQPDKLTGNEDCLTVSIYKPKNESRHTFPVIANIFGGAFSFGGTVEDEPKPLMNSGNVILVKINHRVGSLGFLSTGDAELPGNMGLKDQKLALRWIKNNIGYFGGEPDNVLFLGFSSGAASVHLQLMNEDVEQLVKAGVSISANALDPWVVQGNGRRLAFELGRIVGCGLLKDSSELKKCLKTKDAMDIAAAMSKFLVFDFMPFVPFGPVVEPADSAEPFMTQHPSEIIKSGKFAQIPWLVTYTPEDGIYNAALVLLRQSNGLEAINELNNRWFELAPHFFAYRYQTKTVEELDNRSRELRQHYMGNKSFSVDTYFDFQRMVTDVMLKNATETSLDLHRKYGKSPLYSYVYDNPADNALGQILSGRQDLLLGT